MMKLKLLDSKEQSKKHKFIIGGLKKDLQAWLKWKMVNSVYVYDSIAEWEDW